MKILEDWIVKIIKIHKLILKTSESVLKKVKKNKVKLFFNRLEVDE